MSQIINGFILTNRWTSYKGKGAVELFVKCGLECVRLIFTNEAFTLFVSKDENLNSSLFDKEKPTNLKTFNGQLVKALYCNEQDKFLKLKESLSDKGIRSYENDIWPNDRFLMERFIFGDVLIQGEFEIKNQIKTYINPNIKAAPKASFQFNILSFDIETGVDGSVYSIGACYYGAKSKDKVYMRTNIPSDNQGYIEYFLSEKEMIEKFLMDFHQMDPDVIIGWHVVGFDLRFLIERSYKLGIEFNLSRANAKMNTRESANAFYVDIPGRVVIDGPKALKSMFLSFENFKLETVATSILGASKDIASDGGKVSEIERRFREDKVSLAKYNLLDCTLVRDIYNKINVIDFHIERTRNSGLLFDKLGISTAEFDFHYLPKLHRKGYVAPNSSEFDRDAMSTGGYVLEPKVGVFNNVGIFDFKSLYPSIIRTFKIDPLSLVESNINPILNPFDQAFSSTNHILPDIIKELLDKRAVAKKEQNESLSMAIKILMNSFYGVMGSTRSRFYHATLPSAITQIGQWIIKTTIAYFESLGLEVLYGDTDSIFIRLDMSRKPQDLVKQTNTYLNKLLMDKYKVESFLELEFEKSYPKLFFGATRDGASGAKKKYAAWDGQDVHFKGMESVRSDWTKLAKDFQKAIFVNYFQDKPLEEFIKNYVGELKAGFYDDKLVYKKRLTKRIEEYTKNIPVHVRAAKLINHTGPYRLKEVSYCMTTNGPIPIENDPKGFDYEHYIEKQIKPIADQVLMSIGTSYDDLFSGKQLAFF
ncbi:MAG: DNA polymerase II [Bacteriovoracaceae bacterium]|jgi:DNA polymerase-2|nr:DNA polymerase II [Bacteriovoracaceae bacterium]